MTFSTFFPSLELQLWGAELESKLQDQRERPSVILAPELRPEILLLQVTFGWIEFHSWNHTVLSLWLHDCYLLPSQWNPLLGFHLEGHRERVKRLRMTPLHSQAEECLGDDSIAAYHCNTRLRTNQRFRNHRWFSRISHADAVMLKGCGWECTLWHVKNNA